ncbi:hypothetical protein [Teichococcus aestuarii]|uniref:hypothetical protein n=1 Tax=Teichococcus aestuarii TaxID=568898 RepID=UPI0036076533
MLRLLDPRHEVIVPALGDQFRRAPGFLRFAPLVIGLDDRRWRRTRWISPPSRPSCAASRSCPSAPWAARRR